MKRFLFAGVALFAVACGPITVSPKPPTPPVPITSEAYCAAPSVHGADGHPLAGAFVTIGGREGNTNQDGYLYLSPVAEGIQELDIRLDNYVPYKGEYQINSWSCDMPIALMSAHVDPSRIPLRTIAAVQGAMWPQGLGLPQGPRPNAPDNIIATDFFHNYSLFDQQRVLAWENDNRYKHVVVGPLIDSDGYHGIYRPTDWTQHWDEFMDIHEQFYDNVPADHSRTFGQIPITFIKPDGMSLQETIERFTPFLQLPRSQRLIRFAVVAWEPGRYDLSSCTWAAYVSWLHTTLPNAVIGIHTVADVDAPVGTDALCDDNGKPNGLGWARVADAGLMVWLVQNGKDGGAYRTAPADDPSLAYSFAGQFSTGPDGAATHGAAWHFANSIEDWPHNSGWGPDEPIHMIAAEQTSYTAFWYHLAEVARQAWGNLCMTADACRGYLDGGTTPVPAR